MERSTCKLLFHRGGVTIRFQWQQYHAGSTPVIRTTLKAFIDAALSVFSLLKNLAENTCHTPKSGAQHIVVRLPNFYMSNRRRIYISVIFSQFGKYHTSASLPIISPLSSQYHNKSATYPKQNISPFPVLPLDIYRNMLLNTVCIFREVYLKQSCFRGRSICIGIFLPKCCP